MISVQTISGNRAIINVDDLLMKHSAFLYANHLRKIIWKLILLGMNQKRNKKRAVDDTKKKNRRRKKKGNASNIFSSYQYLYLQAIYYQQKPMSKSGADEYTIKTRSGDDQEKIAGTGMNGHKTKTMAIVYFFV